MTLFNRSLLSNLNLGPNIRVPVAVCFKSEGLLIFTDSDTMAILKHILTDTGDH